MGDKSFCNLFETNLAAFNGDWNALLRAHYLAGRANYRQTVVDFRDGILQTTWHELNEFLHLCGTGVTGVVGWEYEAVDEKWRLLRDTAKGGANKMADDLGLPRPKAVTTCKPSGTMSKIMDAPGEGIHKPMGRFIFNNINFSKHDPLVGILQNAGYRSFENPYDATSILVTLPVKNDGVQFTKKSVVREGREVVIEVNDESAIEQLERYKRLMLNYVDYNASITVSYSPDEIPAIVDWIYENWDHYVGVSFLYRNDPTKDAKDLGYPYLPQEVVTEEEYEAYVAKLKPFSLTSDGLEADLEEGCSTGACPIR